MPRAYGLHPSARKRGRRPEDDGSSLLHASSVSLLLSCFPCCKTLSNGRWRFHRRKEDSWRKKKPKPAGAYFKRKEELFPNCSGTRGSSQCSSIYMTVRLCLKLFT
ncbi:hypothetical protein HPP92_004852 [Vanilla planifolia]|uniref:Uncharacterized protein n=1 Tax=Vanilla planifolia TaxID=51239 RepID=A0A835V8I4_VANPL|nr:hypothetical protein HPP92_004852 [Vanilla planifolia]